MVYSEKGLKTMSISTYLSDAATSRIITQKKIEVNSVQDLFFNYHIFAKNDEILRKIKENEGNDLLIKSVCLPKRLNIAGDLHNQRIG